MLTDWNANRLREAIRGNTCLLLLGAGFSVDAQNGQGNPLPTGSALARLLWDWAGFSAEGGSYTDAPLDRVFDAARKHKGDVQLLNFLRPILTVEKYPPWYRSIAYPYWYRIYSTNVDNLIERVFRDARTTTLRVFNALQHSYEDRDQFLQSLQYVKLSGSLTENLDSVTFGVRQFAARANEQDPWYDHFARDYSTYTPVIIGSRVTDPPFWQAIQARGKRLGVPEDRRLGGFFVADKISPDTRHLLSDFKLTYVEASAQAFVNYLSDLIGEPPTPREVIVRTSPNMAPYFSRIGPASVEDLDLKSFFGYVRSVPVGDPPQNWTSPFHQGATPLWEDIQAQMDALFELTASIEREMITAYDAGTSGCIHAVLGHRGAGKSTTLMRVAYDLAAGGRPVLFTSGSSITDADAIDRSIRKLGHRVLVVIDDAEWLGPRLPALIRELRQNPQNPAVLLGLRTPRRELVDEVDGVTIHSIGPLGSADIDAVIAVLTKHHSLGAAVGKDIPTLRREFEDRYRKQLLVALKEITSGGDFDVILRTEYGEIGTQHCKTLYGLLCLATAEDVGLSQGQLIASVEQASAVTLNALATELRGVAIPTPTRPVRYTARHPVIAESVIDHSIPKPELGRLYSALLDTLVNQIGSSHASGETRVAFRLYKRLINHRDIYRRFERDVDQARAIYLRIKPAIHSESQYWLQFASLELEYGELGFAEKYLSSAERLAPNDFFVRNTRAHLTLKQAVRASRLTDARLLYDQGRAIANALIDERGESNDHPWHILLSHCAEWVDRWISDPQERLAEYQVLRDRAEEATLARPRSEPLASMRRRIDLAYLQLSQEE